MKRYIQVTKAVKRLICMSQQIAFQHAHYGVASAKLFMLVWDRFSRRNILLDGLLCELAVTFATELDTENGADSLHARKDFKSPLKGHK